MAGVAGEPRPSGGSAAAAGDAAAPRAAARGAAFGLAAAASFGISAPLAKALVATIPPLLLAALLYLGAAAGLWAWSRLRPPAGEARIARGDYAALAAVVLFGGVLGPLLMLLGLERVSALTGSLLLNLEAPMTMLIAVSFFGEQLAGRAAAGALLIVVATVLLRVEPGLMSMDSIGIALLAAACACWGIDNNLTQRLTLRDPMAVVRVKATAAGVANLVLALAFGQAPIPSLFAAAAALALGGVSYGASVLLDAHALRLVGAAREAAWFATAPFVGALVSLLFFGATLRAADAAAMLLMLAGVALLLRERHSHRHLHEPMQHEHRHLHDEHHRHRHAADDPPGEPHSHPHRHERLEHEHPHVPDAHHRHRH